MRIVVFSDSHNNLPVLIKIMELQPSADYYIHLGDGARDFESLCALYPDKAMYNVRGNCDWASGTPNTGILMCAGKKVFYTHGHTFYVKSGLEELKGHAHSIRADIALFGHTHIPHTEYDNGLYLMNPGSAGASRASFGIIDITAAGIALNLAQV